MEKFTNALITESSPYLLQHAHNPVNWVAWSEDVFDRAAEENKLVLISVGYSSCHWCHVMEHESFEDEEVAVLMNQHFICVKVDREERPDVDQVYMTAVQLMTQKGGWPLNCFTLPDGRPVYGGTYFPKEQWMHILNSLHQTWTKDKNRAIEYAERLHEGILNSELIEQPAKIEQFEEERLHELILRWSRNFDRMEGGDSRAPKFPLPNNYLFLLRYGTEFGDEKVMKHTELSLDKMALGGIYDQIGGGFTRYSVDMLWKVPHFEKMLYDNGQLLSLYSQAYKYFQKPLYKRIVIQTTAWLEREMQSPDGAFYSALDADSEGEEGKFYCWNIQEMKTVLENDFEWVSDFYNLNQRGYWEEEKYIPLRTESDLVFAKKYNWSIEELEQNIARINQKLLDERSYRIRPGLDDKCLTSWNAMALKGYCDAYAALGDEDLLDVAKRLARWIVKFQIKEDGKLWRTRKNGRSTISGFLEDYAHTIDAFISMYQVTFDSEWLNHALKLMEIVQTEFYDSTSGMCYFTSSDSSLIARKMEINDNVIPASNSVMAHNFFRLGHLFYRQDLIDQAKQMLANVYEGMEQYGSGYTNWALLLMDHTSTHYDVVVKGSSAIAFGKELNATYLPNSILSGGNDNNVPVVADKEVNDSTMVFVCYEGTCLLPSQETQSAIQLINRGTK
jgi:uncharacterized protein